MQTLESQPRLAAFTRTAHVDLSDTTARQTSRLLQAVTNLLDLTISVNYLYTPPETALLARLHHLQRLSVSTAGYSPAQSDRTPLPDLFGRPAQAITLEVDGFAWDSIATYSALLGDRLRGLVLPCHKTVAGFERQVRGFSPLRAAKMRFVHQILHRRTELADTQTKQYLAVLKRDARSFQHLQTFEIEMDDDAWVPALQLLADPTVFPNLRTTPSYYFKARSDPSIVVTKDDSVPDVSELLKAAEQGLRERKFWSDERLH